MTTTEFNLLSRPQKAVLVAKDVLKQLKIGKYIANSGSYVTYDLDNYELVEENKDIKDNFKQIKNCEVCALGSMLMSCVHLGNSLTFQDLQPYSGGLDDSTTNPIKIQKLFKSIFTPKTLLRIEYAFEGYSGTKYARDYMGANISEKQIDKLNDFCHDNYRDDEQRLILICKNIIKNNGKFIL